MTARFVASVSQPALFGRTFFVERGGLASYQELIPSPTALWHEMLAMVVRGTPAGTIPVRRAKEFVLALDLDEADHLGLKLPRSMILRADRIISTHKPRN